MYFYLTNTVNYLNLSTVHNICTNASLDYSHRLWITELKPSGQDEGWGGLEGQVLQGREARKEQRDRRLIFVDDYKRKTGDTEQKCEP